MTPERAANLMRDDEFRGELNKLKSIYTEALLNTHESDIDKRESFYRMIRAIDAIISHFEAIAATTEMKSKRWKIL
jgi:hypothetical protein